LTLYLSKDLISNPNVVWVDGKSVTDFEVISEGGINIVRIPVTETTERVTILGSSVVTQPIPEPEPDQKQRIPDWVRNIFIWYGDGIISEDELINALRFLIQEGTIEV